MGPTELPPPVVLLQMITGRWLSHTIGVAAELGIADEITSGPKTAEEIAKTKDLDATSVYRMLRALASFGIFAENGGRWSHTPLSDALRSDVPYSMRGMARMVNLEVSIKAWTRLDYSMKTGESAFKHVFGMGGFEYFDQHPADREIFANAMSSFSAQVGAAVASGYDFSPFRRIADIGGSHGMLASMILGKNPKLEAIVFDRPSVIETAPAALAGSGVADRVKCVGGDFFESVPAGADAYILKHILHDWSDVDSIRILKNVHAAAAPGTKLLLVEGILEEGNGPQFAKLLDIEMLALTLGGRERTAAEWNGILGESGFKLERVVPLPAPAVVIEATRV